MNVFDKFIMGDTGSITWCFENRHFIERLNENGISREFVVDCLLNEEPISWEHIERENMLQCLKHHLQRIIKKLEWLWHAVETPLIF